jgi:hypothetical protein
MQKIAQSTLLEETKRTLLMYTTWILTAIEVFGPINLRLKLIICLDKIYQWLAAVITSKSYHGALKVRMKDTGLWFIDGARFARWKATADDFIWICGTRMYSHHLRIIIVFKSVLQLVRARLS